MNHGPLLFLGAFIAFILSWLGLVFAPQLQLGSMGQGTNAVVASESYPYPRPGAASQGAEVYRANGCFYCHSQQVRQTGIGFNVFVTLPKPEETNDISVARGAIAAAAHGLDLNVSSDKFDRLAAEKPLKVLDEAPLALSELVKKRFSNAGARVDVVPVARGVDIQRGWGDRGSVARDFLYQRPVMLGSQRIGPDLANFGQRYATDIDLLRHLYDAHSALHGSVMPPFRFLFDHHKVTRKTRGTALRAESRFVSEDDQVVAPTADAVALAAYLRSLRSSTPILDNPLPRLLPRPAPPSTNAPAGGTSTNSPAK